MILANQLDYRRLGAGSSLLEREVKKAKNEGLTMSLSLSPQGYGLYEKMGFEDVGIANVQVERKELALILPMMVS